MTLSRHSSTCASPSRSSTLAICFPTIHLRFWDEWRPLRICMRLRVTKKCHLLDVEVQYYCSTSKVGNHQLLLKFVGNVLHAELQQRVFEYASPPRNVFARNEFPVILPRIWDECSLWMMFTNVRPNVGVINCSAGETCRSSNSGWHFRHTETLSIRIC